MYYNSKTSRTPNSEDTEWVAREPDFDGHPEEEEVAHFHFTHPLYAKNKFWPGEMFVKVDLREINLTILDFDKNVLLRVVNGQVKEAARVFGGIDALVKEIEAM